ncbi:unnamed protein product [Strongylus vulgaris]|uniref:Uncharacterized protein n=1 Tax=Strongylus vulgaris TaxID=40348 RepID=A0A3P7LTL4_STRVU|nr:unnamed protein product [Strongylus vulgaris]
MRSCKSVGPPLPQSLPPPLITPPVFPPLLNAWSNPAVTYTRITVEDLLGTAAAGSMRTQLNPLACPFQPILPRTLSFAQYVVDYVLHSIKLLYTPLSN